MRKSKLLLLAGAAGMFCHFGYAATPNQAAQLKTTLTPMGGERAGSADGYVPAWTGGDTTLPAGFQEGDILPNTYGNEQPIFTVTPANEAQYASMLTPGQIAMLTKYGSDGFVMKVYPSHRTAAAPQWVYDDTFKNATTTKISPQGIVWGISNAYGGPPFPIPDTDANAGAEIIWNHELRWSGVDLQVLIAGHIVGANGQVVEIGTPIVTEDNPYYQPDGSADSMPEYYQKTHSNFVGPADLVGEQLMTWYATQPATNPNQIWVYLAGQGRVRKAPAFTYDTPSGSSSGLVNYDEYELFSGGLERYNWKLVGKAEMIVPYNNYAIYHQPLTSVLGAHFVNPDLMRWEVHRVWIVDATLAQGQRHVEPHRRFYVDEDSWNILMSEAWDAKGHLWKFGSALLDDRPDMPGLLAVNYELIYDLQSGRYLCTAPDYSAGKSGPVIFKKLQSVPSAEMDPQTMAAQSRY
jgi:hypothetical protein